MTDKLYFNPRPPRGGRPCSARISLRPLTISIHAPREGGDPYISRSKCRQIIFQSTPPARGATLG